MGGFHIAAFIAPSRPCTLEKDFQTIKSLVKLRPIYSYTDPKVQAHVALCILALLVQRSLEQRLRAAGLSLSAPACIDILKIELARHQAMMVYRVDEVAQCVTVLTVRHRRERSANLVEVDD